MHKQTIETGTLIQLNLKDESKESKLLQVYINLAKCDFTLKLMNPERGFSIQSHDNSYALSLSLGSMYEALSNFDNIKKFARESITSSDGLAYNSLNFLCSSEINSLKKKELFKVRNKLAFHTDFPHILAYLKAVQVGGKSSIDLIQSDNENEVFFPLAKDVISTWIVDVFGGIENATKAGELLAKTVSHLSNVVYTLCEKWLDAKLHRNV